MNMLDDKRKIKVLYFADDSTISLASDVKAIMPYLEVDGNIWFEIRDHNDTIVTRINSRFIETIVYELYQKV